MSKTNAGLVEYAKAMLGHPYWYGCYGQISTKELYKAKKKQYPKMYEWSCPKSQLGVRVFDCVGLIKGYLWSESINSNPKYNPNQDVSANGMLEKCKTKGKITSLPEMPGTLVFKSGHVGVYIGNGKVIEARGHAYGVVKTNLKDRGWTNWGYCPWIEYKKETSKTETKKEETKKPTNTKKYYSGEFPKLTLNRALKFGSRGEQVKKLQKFLNWYGNYKLKIDGIFGSETQKAVKDYQKKEKLEIDGKFGKKSLAKAKTVKK